MRLIVSLKHQSTTIVDVVGYLVGSLISDMPLDVGLERLARENKTGNDQNISELRNHLQLSSRNGGARCRRLLLEIEANGFANLAAFTINAIREVQRSQHLFS